MKKLFILLCVFIIFLSTPLQTFAYVKGYDKSNYWKYEKPIKDPHYGYNKGECKRKYTLYEEEFYNKYYDHWNVDLIYDRKTAIRKHNNRIKRLTRRTIKCKLIMGGQTTLRGALCQL